MIDKENTPVFVFTWKLKFPSCQIIIAITKVDIILQIAQPLSSKSLKYQLTAGQDINCHKKLIKYTFKTIDKSENITL